MVRPKIVVFDDLYETTLHRKAKPVPIFSITSIEDQNQQVAYVVIFGAKCSIHCQGGYVQDFRSIIYLDKEFISEQYACSKDVFPQTKITKSESINTGIKALIRKCRYKLNRK